MSLLRFALSSLAMESWPWSRDIFEMFGLLLAMPLCLIAIPFPMTGGLLLCADAVLAAAVAYWIGQPLGGMPPFGGWILFCNLPVFLLGLFVIHLRCVELGIGFWDAFRRREPPQQGPAVSGPLPTLLSWIFAPRAKAWFGIVWTVLSVAGIAAVRFAGSCMILVVTVSFPVAIFPLILFNMNKIGERGALLGCFVAGLVQWFVLVPALAGFVRRRSERQSAGGQSRRPIGAIAAVLVCLGLLFAIGKGLSRWGDEIAEPMEEVAADPPMVIAASRGQFEVVEELVRQGKDVNSRGQGGRTPLMSAAARGDMRTMRLLIKNGADVNAKKRRGATVLEMAVFGGQMAAVKLLAEHGAVPGNALLPAVLQSDADMVRFLLDHGADMNARDKRGRTILMHVAFKAGDRGGKDADILNLLLERGADVHIKDQDGRTVLQRLKSFKQANQKLIAVLEAAEASQRRP